jgi:hypothetical protein
VNDPLGQSLIIQPQFTEIFENDILIEIGTKAIKTKENPNTSTTTHKMESPRMVRVSHHDAEDNPKALTNLGGMQDMHTNGIPISRSNDSLQGNKMVMTSAQHSVDKILIHSPMPRMMI